MMRPAHYESFVDDPREREKDLGCRTEALPSRYSLKDFLLTCVVVDNIPWP